MNWRVARSLSTLFTQLDEAAPGRLKASDGTIGDAAHQQSDSDHNPRLIPGAGAVPVVTAGDYTHDPGHGADMRTVSEALRTSHDSRIKYCIFNRRIYSGAAGPQPWVWLPYHGDNPHDKHMHVSVVGTVRCDDPAPWQIGLKEDEMNAEQWRQYKADMKWLRDWLEANNDRQLALIRLKNLVPHTDDPSGQDQPLPIVDLLRRVDAAVASRAPVVLDQNQLRTLIREEVAQALRAELDLRQGATETAAARLPGPR